MNEHSRTDTELRKEIRLLQTIQKTHAPASKAWQTASELLAPLFAEMARRYPNGG